MRELGRQKVKKEKKKERKKEIVSQLHRERVGFIQT